MKTISKKSRNVTLIRIPLSVMEAARLEAGALVDVRAENGRIIIERRDPPEYDLGELVKHITRENRHELVDFGQPVGRKSSNRSGLGRFVRV